MNRPPKRSPRRPAKPAARSRSEQAPAATNGRAAAPFELGHALVRAFLTNERVNQVLLDLLDPRVWRRVPPGSQRRTIASSFAHIHNVRRMAVNRARTKAESAAAPLVMLDRATLTPAEARKGLAESARAFADVVARACAAGGRVRGAQLDAAGFVCAELAHEAHHRGQICHWARALGAPIPDQIRLWEWHKRAREVETP
jgi:uncharacterized damage-inducible protein DinB